MPIYYVIMERVNNLQMWSIWTIIKSIACTLEDADRMYRQEAAPLYEQGKQIQVMYFYREPPNPIQEKANG